MCTCVYIATAGLVEVCVWDLTTTHSCFSWGVCYLCCYVRYLCYAIPVLPACTLHVVCMLVAHNTVLYTLRHQHLWCVLSLYILCSLYLQDSALYQACTRRNAVRAQELLVLGANVNCRGRVSYIVPTCTSTSGCMCCVSIHCIPVQSQWDHSGSLYTDMWIHLSLKPYFKGTTSEIYPIHAPGSCF